MSRVCSCAFLLFAFALATSVSAQAVYVREFTLGTFFEGDVFSTSLRAENFGEPLIHDLHILMELEDGQSWEFDLTSSSGIFLWKELFAGTFPDNEFDIHYAITGHYLDGESFARSSIQHWGEGSGINLPPEILEDGIFADDGSVSIVSIEIPFTDPGVLDTHTVEAWLPVPSEPYVRIRDSWIDQAAMTAYIRLDVKPLLPPDPGDNFFPVGFRIVDDDGGETAGEVYFNLFGTPIPEPNALGLLGVATVLGLWAARRRRP